MDQTSSTAAVVVPIAAALGVTGMLTTLALAARSSRDVICPQRARREALEAAGAADRPMGGTASIGTQRDMRTPVA